MKILYRSKFSFNRINKVLIDDDNDYESNFQASRIRVELVLKICVHCDGLFELAVLLYPIHEVTAVNELHHEIYSVLHSSLEL